MSNRVNQRTVTLWGTETGPISPSTQTVVRGRTETDIKYYNLLKAWHANEALQFSFIDSHQETGAIRDSSLRATVERSLKERLRNSRKMVLIIGKTTREDTDWVPLEIRYAVDSCQIPIIAAYPGYQFINKLDLLAELWPAALRRRVSDGSAHVIHVPFSREPMHDVISQFDCNRPPNGGRPRNLDESAYRAWGPL
jgi:hypothetical protein